MDLLFGNKGADYFELGVLTSGNTKVVAGATLTIGDFSTEDTLVIEAAGTSVTVNMITVADGGTDVTLTFDTGTITLAGIGDGTLTDLFALAAAGYTITLA